MEFIYGFIGFVLALLLFTGGGFAGFWLRGKLTPKSPDYKPTDKEKERQDRELKQMIEQQEAFRVLQNYSTEMAYGMVGEPREQLRTGS